MLLPLNAVAEGYHITPIAGERFGGEFEDFATGSRLKLEENESYGLIFGWEKDGGQFELQYSLQPTQLSASNTISDDVLIDIDVTNLLVASRYPVKADSDMFYSVMGGITHFDARKSNLSSDTRFALGVGAGVDFAATEGLGLRFELRGIATFVDTDSGAFCNSTDNCPIVVDTSLLWQWELLTGLSFRF
ncbi:MAG: hypothetical protein OEU50_16290 [Gammaproteobacteria bacterium]|nr:hypothetical protein [Gammaproteobacteria bacterium]